MAQGRETTTAAFTYRIDLEHGLAVLTYHRQPTAGEWQRLMARLIAESDYRVGLGILSDRRALTETVETTTIHKMADWVLARRHAFSGCRWAVVVSPLRIAEYGMARMGTALFRRAGVTLQAFTDYDQAFDWVSGSEVVAGSG